MGQHNKREETSVLIVLPTTMKRQVARAATRHGTSINNLIVGILAKRYSVAFSDSGRRGKRATDSPSVVLRMPRELKFAIQVASLQGRTNMSESVRSAIAEELQIRPPARRSARGTPFGGGRGRRR